MTVYPLRPAAPDLPPITHDNQWTCRVCGKQWVVATLARDCERSHR